MSVPRAGAQTVMLVVCALVAALLTGYDRVGSHVLDPSAPGGLLGATAGVLLVAPGLATYVLTRSQEHALASRLLAGMRAITIGALLLPIAAASSLIGALALGDDRIVTATSPWGLHASWVAAAVSLLSWVLPPRRSRWRDD
jgi:hypothetical protein